MIYLEKENIVFQDVVNKLEIYKNLFREKKIEYKIRVSKKDKEFNYDYTSEIEIEFYKSNDFYDIIEFFVYHKGKFYPNHKYLEELDDDLKKILASI